MFVSWEGRGWIVVGVTAGSLLASDLLTGLYCHNRNYYSQHGWPKLAAFWVAAAIVQGLAPKREEVLQGARDITVRTSVLDDKDRLFRLPIRYWPLVLFVLGILSYFLKD